MSILRTIAFGAALALGASATAIAADVDPAAIEAASTPAQHQALATQYRDQAAEASQHAAHHKAMGQRYLGDKYKLYAEHCEKLEQLYSAQAKEYEALAALHETMAK